MSNPFGAPQGAGDKASTPLFGGNAFGNKTPSGTPSLFGQNTSSNDGSKSLFGGAGGTSAGFGSFGQQNQQSATAPGSGAATSSGGSSTSFGFGIKQDENKQLGGSSFSAFATPSKPSLFGNPSQPQTSNPFSAFESNSNAASQAPSGSATPTTSQPAPMFGNVSTTPAGPPPTKPPSMFSFNQSEKSGQTSGQGLFSALGATQNTSKDIQPAATTASTFGSKPQTPSTSQPSSFLGVGTSTSQPSTNMFGTATSGSNLFGKPSIETKSQDGASTAVINPGFFSTKSTENQAASSTGTPPVAQSDNLKADQQTTTNTAFSFPALSSPAAKPSDVQTTNTSTPSLFANSATGGKPSTLFGNATDQTKQPSTTSQPSNMFSNMGQKQEAKSSAASTPGLFANIGAQQKDATSSSTSSGGLFASVGQKRDAADSAPKPLISASTTAGPGSTSAPTASPAPASSTLFGALTKPVESSSTAQPNPAAATTTNTAALGSSTAGPAPSAQSRLKNKSMDEIITRWASDLSKYQKEFQAQAERVASWDRMLLENGNAISKLYSKTFQAERDIAEVEKQLTSVEGHQEELSQWLDRYEREVEEMMQRQVGQGEGLQGPDQERERTYKTAERVSERLKDMGKNLTGMIEEINEASSSISKTSKADDPLSQIVRVLNGHLSQLQLIDQSTANLQSKVADAQKKSKQLGSRSSNMLGKDAVDDFYRSYMN